MGWWQAKKRHRHGHNYDDVISGFQFCRNAFFYEQRTDASAKPHALDNNDHTRTRSSYSYHHQSSKQHA
eukprot:scaffold5538_cov159-Amphora_coffeaeformis.AAC.7